MPEVDNFYYLNKSTTYILNFDNSLYNKTALPERDEYLLSAKQFFGTTLLIYNNKNYDSFGKEDKSDWIDIGLINSKTPAFQTLFLNTSAIRFSASTGPEDAGLFLNIAKDANFMSIKKGFNLYNILNNGTRFLGYFHLNEFYESITLSGKMKNFDGKINLYAKYVVLNKHNKTKFYDYPNRNNFDIKTSFDHLNTVRYFLNLIYITINKNYIATFDSSQNGY